VALTACHDYRLRQDLLLADAGMKGDGTMKIRWEIGAADEARVRELIARQRRNALVRMRREINCAQSKPQVRRQRFWQQMVSMRLTSLQNSSPGSPVGRFARADPYPLTYEVVLGATRVKPFILHTPQNWGVIRFADTIADQLARNFAFLEQGGWRPTLKECDRLTVRVRRATEAEVAAYIQDTFLGFGPKQSRNLLQALGLTQYEIPIDSRVTDWLNDFGFPVRLTAAALGDIHYYNFISDGIQALCRRSRVLPCILDAAIFTLKEGEDWTEDNAF